MARTLVAVGIVLLLLVGSVTTGGASEEWCEYDPVVLVTTPGGRVVPVYLLIGAAGLENLPLVTAAQYSRIVEPTDAGRATLVRLEVLVPKRLDGGTFSTRVTASTGAHATGTILDTETGLSGEPMPLTFKLGVP
jgi:NhaP-type Na+/H+ or K+/H+ antiporter